MRRYLTKYEFIWGSILILIYFVWNILLLEVGLYDQPTLGSTTILGLIFFIIMLIIYLLFLINKRAARFKKRMKWKHGFRSCLGLSLWVFLFSIPASIINLRVISPNLLGVFVEAETEIMNTNAEVAKQLIPEPTALFIVPISFLIAGVTASIIVPFFTVKKRH